MAFVLIPATVFTSATFILAVLWRVGLVLLRRPAPRFWKQTLKWHAGLFALHLFVTVPLLFAVQITRFVGTRSDERSYGGPRIAEDGRWLLQTRETLAAEKAGKSEVPPAVQAAAAARAVSLVARDGVKLRAFVVPSAVTDRPRFAAVLIHGLFRGALEIETPGAMLRDLGGEVLLLELRNHGGSGRAAPTFGRDEAQDVLAAVDFVRTRPHAQGRPLVLYAVSLGTAAAAIAAPQVPDLGGIVLDAPMDDLAATAQRELRSGDFWQSIREPWASLILFFARHLRGVPIDEVKPREALVRLHPRVPVLFIGAGHDERMPPETIRGLFATLPTAPDRKELWIEPEATHGKVWVKAPEEYRRRLGTFVEKVLERSAP